MMEGVKVGSAEAALGLSIVLTLLMAAVGFLSKGLVAQLLSDTREHEKKLSDVNTRISVLESSKLHDRVVAIENGLHEIKGDLRVVKAWVESQGDPSRGRRSTDSHSHG